MTMDQWGGGDNHSEHIVGSGDDIGPGKTGESPKTCAREPDIVVKLARIKLEQVRSIAKDAKDKIDMTKRRLRCIVPKNSYRKTISRVGEARKRAWNKAQKKHNNKTKFLTSKHQHCCQLHKDPEPVDQDQSRKADPPLH